MIISQLIIQSFRLDYGRPYRWAQSLSGISYGVGDSADQSLKDLLPPTSARITAKHFIETFRMRGTMIQQEEKLEILAS